MSTSAFRRLVWNGVECTLPAASFLVLMNPRFAETHL
jgi:hypothetical protein